MGQVVKGKKKGRPRKTDLGAVQPPPQSMPERDLRRSHRRRNVKYVFDLDDYFDEDELFADDEDHIRREKKLEILLQLHTGGENETVAPQESRYRRVDHAPSTSESSSGDDGQKPSKKRRIDGYTNAYVDDENDDANDEDGNYNDEDEEQVRERKTDLKAEESPPGTPAEAPSDVPLPDKKALELILDKLQKKDIYGVYAEPVDPEELPDYHDIIEHPMDFATVRSKLGNGSYTTLEQFESDVFLICSNAMQYNEPITVYYKQARTIQELAKRKFEKLRLNVERTEKELKTEHKTNPGSILKKQINSYLSGNVRELVGSDFSSGATLATAVDIQNVANTVQTVGSEKPGCTNGVLEENYFLNDNNLDRAEESLPGKGVTSRSCQKSFVYDENRRSTYAITLSHPGPIPDSIFSTFDGETKQLVPVGLYADHSYARSLARFTATLGSLPWKVASRRIEQALPQGFKFGQGWVGEYEPVPTPVLILDNRSVKEPPFFAKVQPAAPPPKGPIGPLLLEHKLPFLCPAVRKTSSASVVTGHPTRGNNISEISSSFFLSPRVDPDDSHNPSRHHHHQHLQSGPRVESDKKTPDQINGPSPVNKNSSDHVSTWQIPRGSEIEAMEFSPKNANFSQPGPFKRPDSNGVVFPRLPDGKIVGGNTVVSSPNTDRTLTDPVRLMRQLSEKAQIVPSSANYDGRDPNTASLAAARAWMSVGAAGGFRPLSENGNRSQIYTDSLYGSSRDMHMQSQMSRFRGESRDPGSRHVQTGNNISPVHGFAPGGPIPVMVGNQMMQFQNPRMIFPPQASNGDLSRLQLQSTWRSISPQMQTRQKQESFPPDLNIGFQSSGSPGRPSSGVLVDSQQPDLALQL